jgi:heme/copper-type cytochrome/quinol oxidase subunit 4
MCVAACLKIAVIICCVILILMSIAYFVWISELDPDADDYAVAVFVYVFTAVLLWILAVCAITRHCFI